MPRFIDRLRRLRNLVRLYSATRSAKWAALLVQNGVDARQCRQQDDGLYFSRLGVSLPTPRDNVLLGDFPKAAALHDMGICFEISQNDVYAERNGVRVKVDTIEELKILEEIYRDGIYHFDLSGPLMIVDIGMNAAYSTLYFAKMHPDAVIFSYEPFGPTFKCGAGNIELNPDLRPRINAHPYGLSDSARTVDIQYLDKWRGSIGVYGVPEALAKNDIVRVEKCDLRDVAEEFRTLKSEHPQRRIVFKIDCEGSEYAVLQRLIDTNLIGDISLMMIECHRRAPEHDPAGLRASLTAQGFACIHLQYDSPDISMLYAFNNAGTKNLQNASTGRALQS